VNSNRGRRERRENEEEEETVCARGNEIMLKFVEEGKRKGMKDPPNFQAVAGNRFVWFYFSFTVRFLSQSMCLWA
jgi:hypothetical protein